MGCAERATDSDGKPTREKGRSGGARGEAEGPESSQCAQIGRQGATYRTTPQLLTTPLQFKHNRANVRKSFKDSQFN